MSAVSSREVSNNVDDARQSTNSSSRPGSHRLSLVSNETGESSKANSIEHELSQLPENTRDQPHDGFASSARSSVENGNTIHRSGRNRGSGAFLVSNTAFETMHRSKFTSQGDSVKRRSHTEANGHNKGKATVATPEKTQSSQKIQGGSGVKGSPHTIGMTSTSRPPDIVDGSDQSRTPSSSSRPAPQPLDVDSSQIVNLALELSESRKVAARRNVSNPMPPTLTGGHDSFAGGSLRYHLQQQRRASRNMSPKPQLFDRASTASPRAASSPNLDPPVKVGFSDEAVGRQYQFSPSTLARAEKAKTALELMVQYRKLLQYLPPLKSTIRGNVYTGSPPQASHAQHGQIGLGRPYNPLQYIRNRKVRARERKSIDGQAQGFGDLDEVAMWVDRISRAAEEDGYRGRGVVLLPGILDGATTSTTQTSPSSRVTPIGRGLSSKRPRVEWMFDPADMLADAFWLEQDEHKKLIEDRHGQRIFSTHIPIGHAVSEPFDNSVLASIETASPPNPTPQLHLDTKLPQFRSLKRDSAQSHGTAGSRARQKLQDVTHYRDLHNFGHSHNALRSYAHQDSDSSGTDNHTRRQRRGRSGTADSDDVQDGLLEKQMREMLAKEAEVSGATHTQDVHGQKIIESIEATKPGMRADMERHYNGSVREIAGTTASSKERHRRADSRILSDNSQPPSGRASLEVARKSGRHSLDGLDSTTPSSPDVKAARTGAGHIPSMSIDLTPPRSRQTSPSRRDPLAHIRSRIGAFRSRDGSRERSSRQNSLGNDEQYESSPAPDTPVTPERTRRSISPDKAAVNQMLDTSQLSPINKINSSRRKDDERASLRTIFKTGRSRVSELIWKKDIPSSYAQSAISTESSGDDSEIDPYDDSGRRDPMPSASRPVVASPKKEKRSLELPRFTSPFEGKDRRDGKQAAPDEKSRQSYISAMKRRESRRKSRLDRSQPPRIDIQQASPASSPELQPADRSSRNSIVSDTSDMASIRRNSSVPVHGEVAGSFLGLPGNINHKNKYHLPVTGLAGLEARRSSATKGRHWSISDRLKDESCLPMTRKEVARIRALLLTTGVKAQQIIFHTMEMQDFRSSRPDIKSTNQSPYHGLASFNRDEKLVIEPVPRCQQHVLASRILSNDLQLTSRMWRSAAERFSNDTIGGLLDRVDALQDCIMGNNGLSDIGKRAADEADMVSRDLVEGKTIMVKKLTEQMERMMRRRRRRSRWLRRSGWLAVEWVLVGLMWCVWGIVVVLNILLSIFRGSFRAVKWVLWLS